MLVDVYASQPHYAEHLLPIWRALPAERRGEVWASRRDSWWGPRLTARVAHGRLVLIAGAADLPAVGPRPAVYVEHGAGQSYRDLDPARTVAAHYPGGHHPDNVIGYVSPNVTVADSWHGRPAIAAGCPKLDRWLPTPPAPEPRTVAVTFRWSCLLGPEQKPARAHYAAALPSIVEAWRSAGWVVIGHGHPRGQVAMRHLWAACDVEPCWDEGQVLERAAVLVADNTSLMYEAAALGRAVVALNAPWYRRDVEHGLRFWSHVPGVQVDEPEQLAALDLDRVRHDPAGAVLRRRAVARAYAHVDGRSSERAARFVLDLMEAL